MRYDHKLLKTAREEKLLTIREAARRIGVHESTLARIESGNSPWIKALRKVAEFYGVDPVRRGGRRVA